MKKNNAATSICQICKKKFGSRELIPWDIVREPIKEIIRENFPELPSDGFICSSDLNRFRFEYVRRVQKSNKVGSAGDVVY